MTDIMAKDITTLTVVERDNGLIKYTINSIRKFTNPIPQIIIAHNGSSEKYLKEFKSDNNILIIENPISLQVRNTSNRHGLGLNKIMPLVKTKYTAIIESDVMLLSNKWWQMDDSYDFKACQKRGLESSLKDINYWFMCFVLFRTDLFKNINWCMSPNRPQHVNPLIYNDCGWEMAEEVDKNNAKIKSLEYVKCGSGKTKIFDKSFNYLSFELWEDKEPICAHLYRGSDLNRRPEGKSDLVRWKKICDEYLLKI